MLLAKSVRLYHISTDLEAEKKNKTPQLEVFIQFFSRETKKEACKSDATSEWLFFLTAWIQNVLKWKSEAVNNKKVN